MTQFPEEYTDGYVLFCGQRFLVDPRALIPRLETEELVKYCVKFLEKNPDIQHIADIGTGSGIIPISIAHKISRPLEIMATDLSSEALQLAGTNAAALHTNMLLLHGSLLSPIIQQFGRDVPASILITANLPYVRAQEVVGDLIHEPSMAFLGGEKTGFELYEKFLEQLHSWKNRPKQCTVVIEFGLWQRDIAETVFQHYGWNYSFFEDLRGIERFASIIL